MKLALVGPTYPHRGGIAQYNTSLYRVAVRRFPVLAISFRRLYPRLLFPGTTQIDRSECPFLVPSEPILDSIGPSSWKRAGARLAEYQPDLVVFQWWHPFFGFAYSGVLRSLRRAGSSPTVFLLCHNVMPHERPVVPGAWTAFHKTTAHVFARVDGFLVHSASLAQQVRGFRPLGVVREVFHPIYDLYAEMDEAPVPARGEARTPHILFFGNVRRYKGLDVLIRSLALAQGQLDFRATIAGEFYVDPQPFRRMARESGIDARLTWCDRYVPNEEVPALFRSADLVVLPYTDATQSGVAPLAYQFGVPVIATNVGGLSQVVEDGVSGRLVPPGNPSALAAAIVDYFKEGREAGFRAGVLKTKERLSWDRLVDNILSLLAQVQEVRKSGGGGPQMRRETTAAEPGDSTETR